MEARIKRNIIILIVLTFFILVGMSAGWFFLLVRPQREAIAKVQQEYQQLQDQAAKLDDALKARQQAIDQLQYLEGQITLFRGPEKDPRGVGLYRRLYFGEIEGATPLNESARKVAWRSWMNEYHSEFGPILQRELYRAAALTGVRIELPAIKVDDPPQLPENVKAPANGFLKPLSATNNGQLAVSITAASLQDTMRFFNNINHSTILMVVGNIKLEGYTPNIKTSFTLTPYLIAAGPGAKLSAAGGGAAPAAGAPGAGGPAGPGAPAGPAGKAGPPADAGKAGGKAEDAGLKIKNPRAQAGLATTPPQSVGE